MEVHDIYNIRYWAHGFELGYMVLVDGFQSTGLMTWFRRYWAGVHLHLQVTVTALVSYTTLRLRLQTHSYRAHTTYHSNSFSLPTGLLTYCDCECDLTRPVGDSLTVTD